VSAAIPKTNAQLQSANRYSALPTSRHALVEALLDTIRSFCGCAYVDSYHRCWPAPSNCETKRAAINSYVVGFVYILLIWIVLIGSNAAIFWHVCRLVRKTLRYTQPERAAQLSSITAASYRNDSGEPPRLSTTGQSFLLLTRPEKIAIVQFCGRHSLFGVKSQEVLPLVRRHGHVIVFPSHGAFTRATLRG
jgi:hypothetical protein